MTRLCALFLAGLPVAAQASSFDATWHAFEWRCLAPFERFEAPRVDGLLPVVGQPGAYQLEGGAVLEVTGSSDLGTRSCAVTGVGLVKNYERWSAEAVAVERYRPTDAPGVWESAGWVEPVIAVHWQAGSIRVVETDRES